MVNLHNFIFNAAGIMSKSTILKKSREIGQNIAKIEQKQGNVTAGELQSVLSTSLGKRAGQIECVVGRNETIKAMQQQLNISKELAEHVYNSSASMVIPNRNGGQTLLNLRLDELSGNAVGNVSAHECEHALFQEYSLNSRIGKLLRKIPAIKKLADRLSQKYGEAINSKSIMLQREANNICGLASINGLTNGTNLLEHTRFKSKKSFREFIQSLLYGMNILSRDKDKLNYLVAGTLKDLFKDEARAYKAGGEAEQFWYKLTGWDTKDKATVSELRSELYTEMVKVLNKEKKRALKNWFMTKVGIKPSRKKQNKSIKLFNKMQQYIEKERKNALIEYQMKEEENFWKRVTDYSI